MGKVKLLDCTLRDGGFVNDWAFGYENIANIFERLVSAGIDYVEIGFLDQRRTPDRDRTIMPDMDVLHTIFSRLDKGKSTILGMIDYGTFDIDRLPRQEETFLDGIRVIFKKNDRLRALEYCQRILEKGYILSCNPVSVTSYSDEELRDLVKAVNEMAPATMSVVDTYGLLQPDGAGHYFELFNETLDPGIQIGYHAHNNFQLAYSNTIEIINRNTERGLVIDGSLFGMGKSAGNAPIELLAMSVNQSEGARYKMEHILEAIDVNIMEMYRKFYWGYCLDYFLAASNDCHPSYVQHLVGKRTLSIKSINEILRGIDPPRRLNYDEDYIEAQYLNYQNLAFHDAPAREALRGELAGKTVLLLGPGRNIEKYKESVDNYIASKAPVAISINFIPEGFDVDYVFLTNSKRYVQLTTALNDAREHNAKTIATSNVTKSKGIFDYVLEYSALLDQSGVFPDNSLLMFLRVLEELNVSNVVLAGFDGYVEAGNYYKEGMEYTFTSKKAQEVNQNVIDYIGKYKDKMRITFLTPSLYCNTQ